MFGPIQRQQELRFSLAGLRLGGNTQRGGQKVERGVYEGEEGVNRGNGTDPITVGRGMCPLTQWEKTEAKREMDIER